MIEFNSDGSVKLPGKLKEQEDEKVDKLKNKRCIQIRRELVSDRAPKKCMLHITLSDAITDKRFVNNIYEEFRKGAQVPSKLTKLNEKEFNVEIGTDFKRCTDCNRLINEYREFLY